MNTVSLSIVCMSHLSDVQIEMSLNPEMARLRLNFVKFLLNRFIDRNVEIDPDALYSEFYSKFVAPKEAATV